MKITKRIKKATGHLRCPICKSNLIDSPRGIQSLFGDLVCKSSLDHYHVNINENCGLFSFNEKLSIYQNNLKYEIFQNLYINNIVVYIFSIDDDFEEELMCNFDIKNQYFDFQTLTPKQITSKIDSFRIFQ